MVRKRRQRVILIEVKRSDAMDWIYMHGQVCIMPAVWIDLGRTILLVLYNWGTATTNW